MAGEPGTSATMALLATAGRGGSRETGEELAPGVGSRVRARLHINLSKVARTGEFAGAERGGLKSITESPR